VISLVIITALPVLPAQLFFIQDENIMKDGIGTGYKVTHLNHTFRRAIKIHFYMSVCYLCLLLICRMLPNQTTAQDTHEASPKMCLIIFFWIIIAKKSMLTLTFPASTQFLALFVTLVSY